MLYENMRQSIHLQMCLLCWLLSSVGIVVSRPCLLALALHFYRLNVFLCVLLLSVIFQTDHICVWSLRTMKILGNLKLLTVDMILAVSLEQNHFHLSVRQYDGSIGDVTHSIRKVTINLQYRHNRPVSYKSSTGHLCDFQDNLNTS